MRTKILFRLSVIVFALFLIGCQRNHYSEGMRQYERKNYDEALEAFNNVKESDDFYDESQLMIETIDSILDNKKLLQFFQDSLQQARLAIADSIEKAKEAEIAAKIAYQNRPWRVREYADEFGDLTGNLYISTIAHGTFSNSATRNSYLYAEIRVTKQYIGVLLTEYSELRPMVNFRGYGRLSLRNKEGDTFTTSTRSDWNKNGGLLFRDLYSTFSDEYLHTRYTDLFNFLKNCDGEVRVVVNDRYSSEYRFTIDLTGFIDEFNKL